MLSSIVYQFRFQNLTFNFKTYRTLYVIFDVEKFVIKTGIITKIA